MASPADRPPHTLDLKFRAQIDLLTVHVLGEDDRGLSQFARERLAGIKIASYFDPAVGSLGIDAQNSRHSRNAIVDDAQNQFHRVIAFSLPDDGRAHAVPEPLLHGAERIRILFVVAPDVLGFSPEAKIIRSDIKRVKARALAIGSIDPAADARIVVVGQGFVVWSNKRKHRAG